MGGGTGSILSPHSIVSTVEARLEQPMARQQLSPIVRAAWLALYFQVPNITLRVVELADLSRRITYDQATSQTQADHWLSRTLSETFLDESKDWAAAVNEQVAQISGRTLQRELRSNLSLCVVYSEAGGQVTHLALIACAEHFAFDGTGTYRALSQLLDNMAQGTAVADPSTKAPPERTVLEHIHPDVLAADHSALSRDFMEGFTLPTRCHTMSRPFPSDARGFRTGEARFKFSKEQTSRLLVQAKRLGLTISQLASATQLVPLFRPFPATPASRIAHTSVINIRKHAGIETPFYGNAVVAFFDALPCANLSQGILSGGPLEATDAEQLVSLARHLRATLQAHQDRALPLAVATNSTLRSILPSLATADTPMAVAVGVVADGILERHIERRYAGSTLALAVEDVHLTLQDPSPGVPGRTSTFRDQLSLVLSFNEQVWSMAEVEEMVQQWAAALLFTLNTTSSV